MNLEDLFRESKAFEKGGVSMTPPEDFSIELRKKVEKVSINSESRKKDQRKQIESLMNNIDRFLPVQSFGGLEIQEGGVSLLGGATGTGKTTLFVVLANEFLEDPKAKIIFCNLEESENMVRIRFFTSWKNRKFKNEAYYFSLKEILNAISAKKERIIKEFEEFNKEFENRIYFCGFHKKEWLSEVEEQLISWRLESPQEKIFVFIDYFQKISTASTYLPKIEEKWEKVMKSLLWLKPFLFVSFQISASEHQAFQEAKQYGRERDTLYNVGAFKAVVNDTSFKIDFSKIHNKKGFLSFKVSKSRWDEGDIKKQGILEINYFKYSSRMLDEEEEKEIREEEKESLMPKRSLKEQHEF